MSRSGRCCPAPPGSLVLVTSRRRLAALEDAAVISLDTLPPVRRRPCWPGWRPGLDCAPGMPRSVRSPGCAGTCRWRSGCWPASCRHHPAWTCDQLAADLAAARDRLALMHAENLSVAAAFDLSYADLTAGQQRLFRRLGLVPGPSFDAYAAAALDGTSLDTARRHLDELYDQHLLAEPAPGRYQLHDLLREHARALAAADDPAESDAATGRLLDYYLHTALAAGRHFASWVSATAARRRPARRPDAPDLSTAGQAAAWLEAERANLHAAADYAAGQARSLHAIAIPAAMSGFLAARGHWDQSAALHQTALDRGAPGRRPARRGRRPQPSWASCSEKTGDYPAAAASLARALALYGDVGDRPGQAYALTQLGSVHVLTGDYPAAAASHQQALALARSAGDRRWRPTPSQPGPCSS